MTAIFQIFDPLCTIHKFTSPKASKETLFKLLLESRKPNHTARYRSD